MADPITRIVVRKGLEDQRDDVILLQGEPGFAIDSKRLYIGDGITAGGVPVGIRNIGIAPFDSTATNLSLTQLALAPTAGDLVYDSTSNVIYSLTGTNASLVGSYAKYGRGIQADNTTIQLAGSVLSVKVNSLDATYLTSTTIGRGLQRVSGNQTIQIATPGPELTFSGDTLYITPAGVSNDKLAVMPADTVKAKLYNAGTPVDVPLSEFAASIKPYVVEAVQATGVPTGTVLDFAGTTAPAGYLLCQGQAVSRATYANLFTVIGTTWGAGDGTTTFNIPDFRRRVAVGSGGTATATLGNAIGNIGGEEDHALTTSEIPSHTHSFTDTYGRQSGGYRGGGGSNALEYNISSGASTNAAGGNGAHNNIQPSVVVNKIIKY